MIFMNFNDFMEQHERILVLPATRISTINEIAKIILDDYIDVGGNGRTEYLFNMKSALKKEGILTTNFDTQDPDNYGINVCGTHKKQSIILSNVMSELLKDPRENIIDSEVMKKELSNYSYIYHSAYVEVDEQFVINIYNILNPNSMDFNVILNVVCLNNLRLMPKNKIIFQTRTSKGDIAGEKLLM